MRKYRQKKCRVDGAFTYEYWWATRPDIYGYRLLKVRLPPASGACEDWPLVYNELEGREDGPIDLVDFQNWDWVIYLPEPEITP